MLLKIINNIINYILPGRCTSCSEYIAETYGICGKCWGKLNFISSTYCISCGRAFSIYAAQGMTCGKCIQDTPYYDKARSVLTFDEYSRKIIHNFKYYDKIYIAKIFAPILCNKYQEEIKEIDLIVSVPMHKLRRLFRGYNQAHSLAHEISIHCSKELRSLQLLKTKLTKSQTYLSRKSRIKNIENTIKINEKYCIKDKKILLIDDVMTTGTTINECSRILKKFGAAKVYVFTIACSKL